MSEILDYRPVTPRIARRLEELLGARHVLYGDPEKLEPYSHDEVAEKEYAHLPEIAVRPGSAAEIAAVMKLANEETHSRHPARRRQRPQRRRRPPSMAASCCSPTG